MVVITLEKCPLALRGDLTKWLQEISPGVYVGQVSARVRDKLWTRVCSEAKNGRATMVFSARNEQHLDFRVHNTIWEPIDFDGIKLMLRPSSSRLSAKAKGGAVDKHVHYGRRVGRKGRALHEPEAYVVVDVETTGLDVETDSIIELGAVRYEMGEEVASFSAVVNSTANLPSSISLLTGITQEDVSHGEDVEDAILGFIDFIGAHPLVMHNAAFDMDFIDAALEELDMDELDNQCIDTLALSQKALPEMASHKLVDLCSFFEIDADGAHRALADCRLAHEVFVRILEKLGS